MQPRYATNQYSGAVYNQTFNLEKDQLSNLEFDVLGFNTASIAIKGIGAIGTSGSVSVSDAIDVGIEPIEVASGTLGPSLTFSEYGLAISGSTLTIDFKSATIGAVGKLVIIVTLKR